MNDILNLEQYASLSSGTIDFNGISVNKYGLVQSKNINSLMPVAINDSYFCVIPGPEFSPFLYRGESAVYKNSKSSLHRIEDIYIRIYWALKTAELESFLIKLPVVQSLLNWKIKGRNFYFRPDAISQHYGGRTNILDFSRSKDVAMFFATHEYKKDLRRYEPLKSGNAVIYTADLSKIVNSNRKVTPLGFHFLPRPFAQKAFGLHVMPDDDILGEAFSFLEREIICINERLSEKYYQMFDGGNLIYPKSFLDEFLEKFFDDNNKTIRIQTVLDLSKKGLPLGYTPGRVIKNLKRKGIKVIDDELEEPTLEIIKESNEYYEELNILLEENLQYRMCAPHYDGK